MINIFQLIRQVINRMFPAKSIEQVERIESPLTSEMITALENWADMYTNQAPWLREGTVKSLNLPALIASEIARQVVMEVKWNITGGTETDKNGQGQKDVTNARSEYLKTEFKRLMDDLRLKLEQGCAAGGMTIKPYPKDGHLFFDWTMDWSLYPVSFTNDHRLKDVIFRDSYQDGKVTYSRLERHTLVPEGIRITQRAFKSLNRETIGTEIPLTDVEMWKDLKPEVIVKDTEGQLFGWFRVATANNVDVDGPMGISVFHKATQAIEEADKQWSRISWEFEGSELAIDVDPTVLRPKPGKDGEMEVPKLNERLFRGVDLGEDASYHVFNPNIRDASLINGLNHILMRVEDLTGLARGTFSVVSSEARTATELKIMRNRTYSTIADNQKALEQCLRDVIRAMDKFASLYNLAPEGKYEVSFEWDDSIVVDTTQQLGERLQLVSIGAMSKAELREWYLGETKSQAEAAVAEIQQQAMQQNMEMLLMQGDINNSPPKV